MTCASLSNEYELIPKTDYGVYDSSSQFLSTYPYSHNIIIVARTTDILPKSITDLFSSANAQCPKTDLGLKELFLAEEQEKSHTDAHLENKCNPEPMLTQPRT